MSTETYHDSLYRFRSNADVHLNSCCPVEFTVALPEASHCVSAEHSVSVPFELVLFCARAMELREKVVRSNAVDDGDGRMVSGQVYVTAANQLNSIVKYTGSKK